MSELRDEQTAWTKLKLLQFIARIEQDALAVGLEPRIQTKNTRTNDVDCIVGLGGIILFLSNRGDAGVKIRIKHRVVGAIGDEIFNSLLADGVIYYPEKTTENQQLTKHDQEVAEVKAIAEKLGIPDTDWHRYAIGLYVSRRDIGIGDIAKLVNRTLKTSIRGGHVANIVSNYRNGTRGMPKIQIPKRNPNSGRKRKKY